MTLYTCNSINCETFNIQSIENVLNLQSKQEWLWFVICPYGRSFDPRAFRWAQTMKLAVEEINQRTDLLPDHVIGYKLFDSCGYPLTGQRAALSLLNGPSTDDSFTCTGTAPLLAVIGESSSSLSVMLSRILQPFKIPVVITALYFLPKTINAFKVFWLIDCRILYSFHRSATFLHVLVSLTKGNTLISSE